LKSPDNRTFSQRVRHLLEWSSVNNIPSVISDKIATLREKSTFFTTAYYSAKIFSNIPKSVIIGKLLARVKTEIDHPGL